MGRGLWRPPRCLGLTETVSEEEVWAPSAGEGGSETDVEEPAGVLLVAGETSSASRSAFFTCRSDDSWDQRKG